VTDSAPATARDGIALATARYSTLAGRPARPLGTGLINDTFLVDGRDGPAVLQRVHPAFGPRVHEDIAAVTARIALAMPTPRLLPADDGALFVLDPRDGRPWRAMTFVPGIALDKADSPARVRAAGALVARWHRALEGWSYEYVHVRPGVHDTRHHLSVLRDALVQRRDHRLYDAVAPLAEALFRGADTLALAAEGAPLAAGPFAVHAHGDLKLSNLLFDPATGEGACLVDLDTVCRMPWALELGDALRSWCNPRGEDVTEATVDRALFSAALEGYREGAPSFLREIPAAESAADGLATIALELAARFLADALHERYFGFDATRYPARGEHNLVRARGQWSLARDALAHRDALVSLARDALR
jgi:Ser/Thr protein kinase RdoA (MazF antagonist)